MTSNKEERIGESPVEHSKLYNCVLHYYLLTQLPTLSRNSQQLLSTSDSAQKE